MLQGEVDHRDLRVHPVEGVEAVVSLLVALEAERVALMCNVLMAMTSSLSARELNFMMPTPRAEAASWNAGAPHDCSMARRMNMWGACTASRR
jgi:hypothetical protein